MWNGCIFQLHVGKHQWREDEEEEEEEEQEEEEEMYEPARHFCM